MATKTLSSEISATIAKLEKLSEQRPRDTELNNQIQQLYDELQRAEGKEWEESLQAYKDAKAALEDAAQEAQKAIDGLSEAANTISKVAKAIDKLVAVIAVV